MQSWSDSTVIWALQEFFDGCIFAFNLDQALPEVIGAFRLLDMVGWHAGLDRFDLFLLATTLPLLHLPGSGTFVFHCRLDALMPRSLLIGAFKPYNDLLPAASLNWARGFLRKPFVVLWVKNARWILVRVCFPSFTFLKEELAPWPDDSGTTKLFLLFIGANLGCWSFVGDFLVHFSRALVLLKRLIARMSKRARALQWLGHLTLTIILIQLFLWVAIYLF